MTVDLVAVLFLSGGAVYSSTEPPSGIFTLATCLPSLSRTIIHTPSSRSKNAATPAPISTLGFFQGGFRTPVLIGTFNETPWPTVDSSAADDFPAAAFTFVPERDESLPPTVIKNCPRF